MRLLIHDPEGWAPNMGWTVRDENGNVLHRGPEWACKLRVEIPSTDLATGLSFNPLLPSALSSKEVIPNNR